MWPTWEAALIVAALCAATSAWTRRVAVKAAARELTLIAVLYALWRIARSLPLAQDTGAVERGRQIADLQHDLRLPSELSLQHFVLDHGWLGWLSSWYYAAVHVPSLVAFLVWLYVRHRDRYPHWRNGLAVLTGLCLCIRFVRVAPPRLVPGLGYIDLSERWGPSIYGPVGTGVSDQFAAMPSIHVGWAAVVAGGIVACSPSPWRWLVALHLPITIFVVAATGHHWHLDGIVAIALLGGALWADTAIRARRAQPEPSDEVLVPAA